MCSARSQFFSIPEVSVKLGPFLGRADIARLMRTSRLMHDIFASVLFRELTFTSFRYNLLESANGLESLAKNIHHVRVFDSGLLFLSFYYHCQRTYEQQQNTTAPLDLPSWLPPPQPLRLNMVPLPPIPNLMSFTCRSTHLVEDLKHPALDKDPNYGRDYLPIVYWLTRSSPNLAWFELELYIESEQQLHLFTGMISGMHNLQWLSLKIVTSEQLWAKLFMSFFFSLPLSLKTLRLGFGLIGNRHVLFKMNYEEDAAWHKLWDLQRSEEARQPLVRRKGPLEDLKSLTFPYYEWPRLTTEEYMALFEDCPGIESLVVPCSSSRLQSVVLGRFIGQHCSKLREVVVAMRDNDTLLSATILTSMTPHSLQTLKIYDTRLDPDIMSTIIDCHSHSLRKIILRWCPSLTSPLIQKILVQCSELEELTLYQYETRLPPLTLADATVEPWATNKLRKLQLCVTVPDLFYLRQKKQLPYFKRFPIVAAVKKHPLVWTDAERGQLLLLERLYSQLGKQTNLEVLHLDAVPEATSVKARAGHGFRFDTFPLMLSLGNPDAGQPGYLDLFKDLKRLKKLVGSFGMHCEDSLLTVGQKEVDWMVKHWVSLQEAHFYPRTIAPRECFLNMQERLPGLKILNYQ